MNYAGSMDFRTRTRRLTLAGLAILPLLFASCEESDLLYIINPDGSGRVTNREKILTSQYEITGKDALEQVAVSTLAEFLLRSKGVDAWEKVSYTLTDSGDVVVEATALFPNLAKLELATTASTLPLAAGLKFDPGAEGRPASIQLRSPILSMPKQAKSEGPPPDEETVAKELAKTRKNWEQAEENIRPSFGSKRSKVTFHLPGDISSLSNFKKDAKNQVSLEVTAPKMIDTLEKVITDDQIANEVLKTGAKILANDGAPPVNPNTFNKLSFGEAKPIRVEFAADSIIFDYAGAVEAAKANPSDLLGRVRKLIESQ